MLRLGGWLAARAWREQPVSAEAARLFAPAREATGALLDARHRKAHRSGRHVERLAPADQHALRVRLKKLRYGAEFLAGAWAEGRSRRYLRRLARVQDVLGHLNDVATAERLLGEILEWIGSETTPEHQRAAGFVAGWTARSADLALGELAQRWKRFADVDPFWRE